MPDDRLEEMSPFGNVVAYAEDDGRTVYFYLFFREKEPDDAQRMKACWVRNRVPAPKLADDAAMERGKPPLMPIAHCINACPGRPLDRDALEIVWFEECDAAALVERDETLAVVPWWSGTHDFSGYSRDCKGESPLAWELTSDNAFHGKVAAAREYWNLWNDKQFWQKWRDERIAAMESALGPHRKYYAIDGDQFPPRAMLRFDLSDRFILITVGLSLFCQPQVEKYFDDPSPYRRIELAAALDRSASDADLDRFGGYISAQARYPWFEFTPLGNGHTMPCDSSPSILDPRNFNSVMFTQSLPQTPELHLPDFRGDPTNVLWLLPITQRERDFAVSAGTDELQRRLVAEGATVVMRTRKELQMLP